MEHSGSVVEWCCCYTVFSYCTLLCKNNNATCVVCLMCARSVLYDLIKPRVPMLVLVRVNDSSQDSPASSYCTRVPRDTFVM